MIRTRAQLALAEALLKHPNGVHYGYDLSHRTGLPSGVLYPALARWRAAGWLVDRWEDPTIRGRSPRRYYRLTPTGRDELTALLAAR